MHRAWQAATALVLLLGFVPPAGAQDPVDAGDLYRFSLFPTGASQVDVLPNGQGVLQLTFVDTSRDGTGGLVPGAVPPIVPETQQQPHRVRFRIDPGVDDSGWFVAQPGGFLSYAGTERQVNIVVQSFPSAKVPLFPFTVTALVTTPHNGTYEVSTELGAYSLGPTSFGAQVPRSYLLKPNEIETVQLRIFNLGIHPRSFDVAVAQNPCGMEIATNNNNVVPGKGQSVVDVSIVAPAEKPWYFSELCTLAFQISPTDTPEISQTAYASVQVNGGFLNPVWVFWVLLVALVVILLVLFAKKRKERIEEELLGKPQKPWTIPVEALYLRALRQKDERAWYVVRHHLMEEEYRSALLWYKSYKKATKGSRKKEAVVLRQEHAYEKWKAKWEKRIARPLKDADRFEAKLQRKLDRKATKLDRKDARAVRRITKKMSAAHGKQVERALEKWQKQVKKAEKKGLAAPPRPVLPEPDYPEEPEPRQFTLAEHKWSKRAARFRARQVKRQGNLEVKFEKADARHLAKLRRKVKRLARKLDDPDFVAEHPLLRSDA